MSSNTLKDRCRVVTQEEWDRFVGIKADTTDALVYFPLGYHLPETDEELRYDILNLFHILSEFKDVEEGYLNKNLIKTPHKVKFPINSYLEIIYYYMENGYYIERDPIFKTDTKGKIDWSRTIKKQKPLLQKNKDGVSYSPIYTQFTVRRSNPNENKEITLINKHCVYEAFKKLGWLFTSHVPQKPEGECQTKRFLTILQKKLSNTNNDIRKKLFTSMINMLEFMDDNNNKNSFSYGTYTFEYVFEKLIDSAFGIKNKDEYFPRVKWNLQLHDRDKNKKPLQPDTIMIHSDKIYVIDAKYYRYGDTLNPNHLPNASSINKQITYGEYIDQTREEYDSEDIFNVFLMPYNMNGDSIELNELYENIGQAVSEWKTNENKHYERVQGILADIRTLMFMYNGNKRSNIKELATAIEKACRKNKNDFRNNENEEEVNN